MLFSCCNTANSCMSDICDMQEFAVLQRTELMLSLIRLNISSVLCNTSFAPYVVNLNYELSWEMETAVAWLTPYAMSATFSKYLTYRIWKFSSQSYNIILRPRASKAILCSIKLTIVSLIFYSLYQLNL